MNDMHATAGVNRNVSDITHNVASHREGYPVGTGVYSSLPTNSIIDNGCQALPSTIEGTFPLKTIKAVPLLRCICVAFSAHMRIGAK